MSTEGKVAVRLDEPSCYRGPQVGSWKDRLHRIRLWVAYRHYYRFLQRYVILNEQGPRSLIVEIGCGPGYLLSFVEKWFPQCKVIGFDYDFRLLDGASQRTTRSHLVRGNAEELPFEDGKFDAIVTLHVVEHLYYPEQFISEARRALRPGGSLLVATPNPKGIGARVMKSRWCGWREDHVSLHTPKEWERLIESQGFTQLQAGTTMLSGIPVFRKFPLAILNYLPLLLFGTLPWDYGEAFIGVFRRTTEVV